MPRRPKERALPVEIFWSERNRRWHGYLPTGERNAKGEMIRKHRESSKPGPEGRAIVERKIRELEAQLAAEAAAAAAAREAAGLRPTQVGAATAYTLHGWLRYWLEHMIVPNREYNTARDYTYTVAMLIEHLPDVPLPELTSRTIDHALAQIRKLGSADKVHRAHRRLRTALNAAEARAPETGLWYNPIRAVGIPALPDFEVEPLTVDEVKLVLAAAGKRPRNGARWIVALALGLRQGEALALRWDDLDLDTGILWVRDNAYRRKWLHGCDDPHACGAKYHKVPCDGRGAKHARYHRRGCPEVKHPCAPDCTEHAAQCKDRHGGIDKHGVPQSGGLVRKPPKSRAGRRPLRMPPQLVAALRSHRAVQDRERMEAGDRWRGDGTVFATRIGTMTNENDDWDEWKAILTAALGHKSPRLHDARHTAATMMLIKKVDSRVVIEAMGWSGMTGEAMRRRYQHVLPEMLEEASEGVADLIWGESGTDSATGHATGAVVNLADRRGQRS